MYDLKHPRPLNNAGPCLQELIRSGPDDVKCCALETVGNLAFPPDNRSKFLAAPAFHELLCRMAGRGMGRESGCIVSCLTLGRAWVCCSSACAL